MRGQLFFEGDEQRSKLTRFWLLLPLSAVIASAGVVGDSTATVIGAMIVAPLMTPILGIALAAALADRPNLLRCLALVVLGACAVIAIGYVVGLLTSNPVLAADNTQVAGRVSPKVVDLVAALATGAVGAVALCRSDISDTLPGVAIAISLVPPLAVVGLTLESGSTSEAAGALLLFTANVTAILAMGIAVMAIYRVPSHAPAGRRTALHVAEVVAAMVVLVAVPLVATSTQVSTTERRERDVRSVASDWADDSGWEVVSVSTQGSTIVVRTSGRLPAPAPSSLRSALDAEGLTGFDVDLEQIPSTTTHL
ncbi:MAG TPA: DUF389 domain-containing protein [Acidimicrobiales bacterium]|nr:DUF389 domain-containing protein [Acidimicrobiales bacterium]